MQKRNLWIKLCGAVALLCLMIGLTGFAMGEASTADPLVSLSYVNGTFRKTLISDAQSAAASMKNELSAAFSKQIASFQSTLSEKTVPVAETSYKQTTIQSGKSFSLKAGNEFLFLSGSAVTSASGVTDTTAGVPITSGGALMANHLYIVSADCSLQASDSVRILIKN